MIRLIMWMAFLMISALSANAQFKNIKLDEASENNPAREPSIAINPRNTKNIVAVSARDNVYYTLDGGATWQKSKLSSVWGIHGNPLIIADNKGDFYAFYTSDESGSGLKNEKCLEHIICQVSKDGGKTWDAGNSVISNLPKDQFRPGVCVDDKESVYITWTQFDTYGSDAADCVSSILFSQSSNGKKWSKPVQLSQFPGNCRDDGGTATGAMPAVGNGGKLVYVAWANESKIFLDRSFDGGNVWLRNDIEVINQPGGWSHKIAGLKRCNGLPVFGIDRSKSNKQGSLYLVWSDQRKGADDTDVWFIRSTNMGDNWTSPVRVNDDEAGKQQYLPNMTVDQATGYLYVLYYDRRNYEDNQTDVYLAYSIDAGSSFKNVKISESPFTPDESISFGDYIKVSAYNGVIVPVWTRMDKGNTSVWTTVISHTDLAKNP